MAGRALKALWRPFGSLLGFAAMWMCAGSLFHGGLLHHSGRVVGVVADVGEAAGRLVHGSFHGAANITDNVARLGVGVLSTGGPSSSWAQSCRRSTWPFPGSIKAARPAHRQAPDATSFSLRPSLTRVISSSTGCGPRCGPRSGGPIRSGTRWRRIHRTSGPASRSGWASSWPKTCRGCRPTCRSSTWTRAWQRCCPRGPLPRWRGAWPAALRIHLGISTIGEALQRMLAEVGYWIDMSRRRTA